MYKKNDSKLYLFAIIDMNFIKMKRKLYTKNHMVKKIKKIKNIEMDMDCELYNKCQSKLQKCLKILS